MQAQLSCNLRNTGAIVCCRFADAGEIRRKCVRLSRVGSEECVAYSVGGDHLARPAAHAQQSTPATTKGTTC